MRDRSSICTKRPIGITGLRSMRYRYVISLFAFLSKARATGVRCQIFGHNRFVTVEVNGVSVIDFCIVCARKIGCAKLARGFIAAVCPTRHSCPKLLSRGGQSETSPISPLNAMEFCISMKVQSTNNRIIRFRIVHPFLRRYNHFTIYIF